MTDPIATSFSKLKIKITATLIIFSFLVSYLIVNVKNNHQLIVDARKLNSAISEPIEWIETLSIHMGKKIAEHDNYDDLRFIDNLFKETLKVQGLSSRIASWSMFSWSNKKHKLAVNTLDGISDNQEDLSDRQYSWRAKYHPWMLQVTKSSRGKLSNTFVIPVAVGVSNSRDTFQGSIISGINAKELLSRAESAISSSNAFLLLNRDAFHSDQDKIVLASANSPYAANDYKKLPALVDLLKDWIDPAGKSPIIINTGRYKFTHYALMDGYQLAILVGFDRVEFWSNVLALWAQIFIGSALICFLAREFGFVGGGRN